MAKQIALELDLKFRIPGAFPASSNSHSSIDCGEGWLAIIETLYKLLCEANRRSDQVTTHMAGAVEKTGTLRILVAGRTPHADAWIKFAEQHATVTCEICGRNGELLYIDG